MKVESFVTSTTHTHMDMGDVVAHLLGTGRLGQLERVSASVQATSETPALPELTHVNGSLSDLFGMMKTISMDLMVNPPFGAMVSGSVACLKKREFMQMNTSQTVHGTGIVTK